MSRQFFGLLLLSVVVGVGVNGIPANAQKGDNERPKGVPEQYAGNWVCQTAQPGYNITPPHADPSQPLTNKITTPPTVVVLKLALKTDGTYQTASAKGHYAFDPTKNAITWLDGPHKTTITKTHLGKRDNGAPTMDFIFNKRYYGCFKPKPDGK